MGKRIDELSRILRLGTIEQQFQCFPFSMLRSLRAILEDRHVSAPAYEHFMQALANEPSMTPEYKERVEKLIEDWFARDSGGAGR